MNPQADQIERIVRQVLAELRAAGAAAATPAPSPAPAGSAAPRESHCVVTERVVTLANLADRLNGVQVLVVPRRAVITPAMRDELRAREIRLEYADNPTQSGPQSAVELIIGVADVPDDVCTLTKAAQTHVGGLAKVQSLQQADLAALTQRLAEAVASRPALGVVVTRRPAAAACLANRHPKIRAAWACSPRAVSEAIKTLAPNVLTYNPAEHTAHVQRAMLQEFARGGVPECPPEFCD